MKKALKNFGNNLLSYAGAAEKALGKAITAFENEYPNVSLSAISVFSGSALFLKTFLQYNFLGRTLITATMMVTAFFTNKEAGDTRLSKFVNFFAALATSAFLAMTGPFISVGLAAIIGTAAFITRLYNYRSQAYAKTAAQIVVPAALFAAPYEMSFLLLAAAAVKCSVDYYQKNSTQSVENDSSNSLLSSIKDGFFNMFKKTPDAQNDAKKPNNDDATNNKSLSL